MKLKITKSRRFLLKLKKNEFDCLILKFLKKNYLIRSNLKLNYVFFNVRNFYLKKFGYKGLSFNKNRCVLTSRSRSVYRLLRVNRITYKNLILSGLVYGYKKSSF
jgi:ribosomal protein S14